MKTFAERIKELREEYDLDQVQLAKRLGVSKSTISKYENGSMKTSIDIMLKIKQEFGKSLDWQMGFDESISDKYSNIITECEKLNIPPEKISEIIQVLKK